MKKKYISPKSKNINLSVRTRIAQGSQQLKRVPGYDRTSVQLESDEEYEGEFE